MDSLDIIYILLALLSVSEVTIFSVVSVKTARIGVFSFSINVYLGLNKLNQNVRRLRFNNFDRAPIQPEDSELFYHCYSQLGKIINGERMAAKRRLDKGLVIFVDNYRVMHGRTGFDGNRTVSGIAFS